MSSIAPWQAWLPIAACALAIPARVAAQGAQAGFVTTIEGRGGAYFEGEPVYLLFTVRNASVLSRVIPEVSELINASTLTVQTSSGADATRHQAWADAGGPIPTDTLLPGESMSWVMPMHWYWGSYRESSEAWMYFAFAPDRYRVAITFPPSFQVDGDTMTFTVRGRTPEEDRARALFLRRTDQAYDNAHSDHNTNRAIAIIRSLHADPSMAPYSTLLLCEIAAVIEVAGRAGASYQSDIEEMRVERMATAPRAEQVRLIQNLKPARLDSLARSQAALRSIPYVGERLRRIARGRDHH